MIESTFINMLGVDQRSDFRRASLVSEIYSETHGPTIGGGGNGTSHQATPVAVSNSGNNGRKASSSAITQVKKPIVRPPPMHRKIPKGKFGLIGLGKASRWIITYCTVG